MIRAALLRPANALCRRLWRDEGGVVLGVTMVALMALYAMAAALFALGEQIRDRIELQNAVDAAAYSAAVVQADTISRIAAINQAMAWTYVQMCRRHMDAILDRWLEYVARNFRQDESALRAYYNARWSGYQFCGWWRNKDWAIGYPSPGGSNGGNKRIRFNKSLQRTISQVEAAAAAVSYQALEQQIALDESALRSMGAAEKDLINKLRSNAVAAADRILQKNGVAQSGDWVTVVTADAWGHFHEYGKQNDSRDEHVGEKEFLRTTLHKTGNELLGDGAANGQWFPRDVGKQPWRRYVQQGNMLVAEWSGFAEGFASRWFHGGEHGCQQWHGISWGRTTRDRTLKGSDIQGTFRPVIAVAPHRLSSRYFDGDVSCNGGIVVAAARLLRHPFSAFASGATAGGFYDAIGNGAGRLMVAAAAARAGYKDEGRQSLSGKSDVYSPYSDSYETIWDDAFLLPTKNEVGAKDAWQKNGWAWRSENNLGITDWDAVLVPLRRVWSRRKNAWQYRSFVKINHGVGPFEPGQWLADSGNAVLSHLWNQAEWKSLNSGQKQQGLASLGTVPGTPRNDGATNRAPSKMFGIGPDDLAKSLLH